MDPVPFKVFVGAYDPTNAFIMFAEPQEIHEEISIMGVLVADVLNGQKPPSDGLWVFEGTMSTTGGHHETDPLEYEYEGQWRRPTEIELTAAASGENPCLTPCGA